MRQSETPYVSKTKTYCCLIWFIALISFITSEEIFTQILPGFQEI